MDISKGAKAGFAPINGIKMYSETKGAGKPLLFLHAGVADSRMWDSQFEAFSKTHFVIRCDLRGFGQSGKAPGLFAHYEDIAALLKYLQAEQVGVIGASFGGAVALDFGLAYPERVTALVLAAPALGGYKFKTSEMLDFFTAEEEALERGDLAAATELNLSMWVDGLQRSAEAVRNDIREQVREMQLNIFAQLEVAEATEQDLKPPAIARLDKIPVPTLVIVGDQEVPEFQAIARLITEQVKHARLVVISDTAHLSSMEKPTEFNRLVHDFLSC